jgi:hypothetical protein
MKKTVFLASVIALGSLTGVAQASPVVENMNQPAVSIVPGDTEKFPIVILEQYSIFFEGHDYVPGIGNDTVYKITPTESGFYVKGLTPGKGVIKINGVKRYIEVTPLHRGPNW